MGCGRDFPKTASAITAVVSIVLYFFDLASDIWLAVEYFKDGHTAWGALTTVCICFPIPVFLILAVYMAFAEDGEKKTSDVLMILFFPFLLITNLFGVLLHICRQYRVTTGKAGDDKTCDVNDEKTTETYENKTCEAVDRNTRATDDDKTCEADNNKTSEADGNKTRETDYNKVREADYIKVREADDNKVREADDSKTTKADDCDTCVTVDRKTLETGDRYYCLATMTQVLDALCESFPQLVMQIYILLVDESVRSNTAGKSKNAFKDRSSIYFLRICAVSCAVTTGGSVLKINGNGKFYLHLNCDIETSRYASMVGSMLMLSWSLTCYEKMKFYMINEENIITFQQKPRNCSLKQAAVTRFSLKSRDMPIGGQISLFVLKFCECLLRVLTFGLLASILQPLRPLFIILLIVGIIIAHFALLTLAECLQDCPDFNLKNVGHLLYGAIHRVVSYITIYVQPNSVLRIVYYYIIVLVESMILAVHWLQFKPDRLDWLSSYAWIIMFPMDLLICALCIYMYYCKRFHNHHISKGSGKHNKEYFRFVEDRD